MLTIPEARAILKENGYTVDYERGGAPYFVCGKFDCGNYTALEFRRFARAVQQGDNPYMPDPRYCPNAFG